MHLGAVPLPLREQMKREADKGDPAWAASWVGSFPVVNLPFSALCPHAVDTFRASVYAKANGSTLLLNHTSPTPPFSCKWSGCLLQPPPILTLTPQEDPAHTRPDCWSHHKLLGSILGVQMNQYLEKNLSRVAFRPSTYDLFLKPSFSGEQLSPGPGISHLTATVWK